MHVLAITTVVGSVAAIDLRLLGIKALNISVRRYCEEILPITWVAFALAVTTGSLLFISSPLRYVMNVSFQMKMALMVAAGINMLIFHRLTWQTIERWDAAPALPSPAARIAGGLSLLLWAMIIFFGRHVGFTLAHG
jgi:hypothetical protein